MSQIVGILPTVHDDDDLMDEGSMKIIPGLFFLTLEAILASKTFLSQIDPFFVTKITAADDLKCLVVSYRLILGRHHPEQSPEELIVVHLECKD